jgi:hypothetical protein
MLTSWLFRNLQKMAWDVYALYRVYDKWVLWDEYHLDGDLYFPVSRAIIGTRYVVRKFVRLHLEIEVAR